MRMMEKTPRLVSCPSETPTVEKPQEAVVIRSVQYTSPTKTEILLLRDEIVYHVPSACDVRASFFLATV